MKSNHKPYNASLDDAANAIAADNRARLRDCLNSLDSADCASACLMNAWASDSFEAANSSFQQALEFEPGNKLAVAGLQWIHGIQDLANRQLEAKRQAEEEARLRAEEEARLKAAEEARLKAEEEARLKAEEEARLKAEEEARLKAEEEARLKAEEEARLKAEEEARLKAEEEARLKAEEEARQKAEEEARQKAEEEARLKAEEEARLKAEEEARLKAEEEARLKAEEEARLKAEEEARLKAEEEAILKAEEEARLKAEEEARLETEQAEQEELERHAEFERHAELERQAELKRQTELQRAEKSTSNRVANKIAPSNPTPEQVATSIDTQSRDSSAAIESEIEESVNSLVEEVKQEAQSTENRVSSTDAGGVNTAKKLVLAVDDSPTVRMLVSLTLNKEGFEVITAEDGVEALNILAERLPDLILTDINMPKLNGYKLCKFIKKHERTQAIPVVMLSGKDGVFDKMRGKLNGCDDFIAKPFESTELIAKVRESLSTIATV